MPARFWSRVTVVLAGFDHDQTVEIIRSPKLPSNESAFVGERKPHPGKDQRFFRSLARGLVERRQNDNRQKVRKFVELLLRSWGYTDRFIRNSGTRRTETFFDVQMWFHMRDLD